MRSTVNACLFDQKLRQSRSLKWPSLKTFECCRYDDAEFLSLATLIERRLRYSQEECHRRQSTILLRRHDQDDYDHLVAPTCTVHEE